MTFRQVIGIYAERYACEENKTFWILKEVNICFTVHFYDSTVFIPTNAKFDIYSE
jgi:hypothetical protein